MNYILHDIDHVASIEFHPDPGNMEGASLEVSVGDVINCTADANPNPSYTWNCSDGTTVAGELLSDNSVAGQPERSSRGQMRDQGRDGCVNWSCSPMSSHRSDEL